MKTKLFPTAIIALFLTFLQLSCSKKSQNPADPENLPTDPITVNKGLQTVCITNPTSNIKLKCILYIPESSTPTPAVVVLHGCSGLWSNQDVASGKMQKNFNDWLEIFKQEKYAAIFVDSFSARNITDFCDVNPPASLVAAAEFVRPTDAYSALNYLKRIKEIIPNKIALLGFSHGATTTLSTIVDADKVAKTTWSVKYEGNTYPAEPPAKKPNDGGFVTAIAYYPGCGFYSYYGSPNNPADGKYVPYAPVLIHAAGNDPLYKDNNYYSNLIQKAQLNGSSKSSKNEIELYTYTNANHSFDGKTSGTDLTSSNLARQRSIEWLKTSFN